MRFNTFKEEDDNDFEYSFDFNNEVDIYRGLAGEYIPPTPQAEQELAKSQQFLNSKFGNDFYAQVKYLKQNNQYARIFCLQRMHSNQSCTTSVEQARDYTIKISKRTGITPPIVVSVKIPRNEMAKYAFKSMDQRGFDVFDVPAQAFASYFRDTGKVMKVN